MSSEQEEPDSTDPDERRGNAELVALGYGCLVVVVFFGALLFAAFMSDN